MKKKVLVQIDTDLHIKGKARAASNRQKFNGYLESLIEKDLATKKTSNEKQS